MRAKFVNESIRFERGQDPKGAMDIGANRKVRKGDRVQVQYKDEIMTVTALDDEDIIEDDVMVRSPHMGMPAEYETRKIREFDFKDDDDGICFAQYKDDGSGMWICPSDNKRTLWDNHDFAAEQEEWENDDPNNDY